MIRHGTEPETAEQLRRRYMQSLGAMAFGGNAADYIQRVEALPGVGGVKVTPAWNGGGTVLLTIADSGMNSPPPGLVAEAQAAIDPEPGRGQGIAPIGHSVTVRGAERLTVSIATAFTFAAGYTFAMLKAPLEQAAADYLAETRARWAGEEAPVVRVSGLEQRFLAVPGVLDVSGTRLNGAARNLTPGAHELPVLGSVSDGS
jgi:uncharacterized phage protein gp47/JayE